MWRSQSSNDAEELAALKAALALGQMLDRVVILPRFHCNMSDAGDVGRRARRRHGGGGGGGAPARPGECPLNCLLNVTAFDAQFQRAYRESSFLRHPLVPPAVRDDRSPLHHVRRPPNASADSITTTTTTATADDDGRRLAATSVLQLNVDDAVRRFGSTTSHVLVLDALYRVDPRFNDVAEQRTFDERVRKAFRRATYRQL